MVKPFFSVIIPALNEEKYLPNLLSDLAAQSYRDFEVIVVDGKSTDQTVKVTKSYARQLPSLTVLTSARRHVCTQRNLGGKKAVGEYLIFMDADNRLPPYFLQGVKYKLESDPCALATTYAETAKPNEYAIISTLNLALELSRKSKSPGLLEAMVIVSRQLFTSIEGFDEDINFAEGPNFVNKARKLGYTHSIYPEPRYTYSLRRVRKFGALKIATNIAIYQLNTLFGEEVSQQKAKSLYPMQGGQLFNQKRRIKSRQFTQTINRLLRNISIDNKPVTLRTLKKQLNSLLS